MNDRPQCSAKHGPAEHTVLCRSPRPGASAGDSFTEEVNGRTGSIRARGDLNPRTAARLRGTVEALHRSGHARILLDLAGRPPTLPACTPSAHWVRQWRPPAVNWPSFTYPMSKTATARRHGRRP